MTSVLLQPRCGGVDGVGLSTLRDFAPIETAGYPWDSVYLGGNYGVQPYAIEAGWAAGMVHMLNYERTADDAKNGYPAGKKAAETALAQAKALGFLGEAPIIFSAADAHFTDLHGAGLDYHRALVDVLAPQGWSGGAYGFKEMLALIDQQSWWPADWPLWHWGGDGNYEYPWATCKQWYGQKVIAGVTVDVSTLLKPMRFWSGYGADTSPDPLPGDDMLTAPELALLTEARDYAKGCAIVLGQDQWKLADVIATAVWAKRPVDAAAGLTRQDVTDGVLDGLRKGTG